MKETIFIFILSFWACKNQSVRDNSITKIDSVLSTYKPFADVSAILSIDKVIPLETNESNIIGKIDKIIADEKYFYILDADFLQNVCLFHRNGKFVSLGFSEEEKLKFKILKISAIDIWQNKLYALNDLSGELYIKDLIRSTIRTVKFTGAVYDFKVLGEDSVITYNNYIDVDRSGAFRFRFMDCSDSIPVTLQKHLPFDASRKYKSLNVASYNRFIAIDSGFLVNEVGNDTLYFLNQNAERMEPKFVINYARPPIGEFMAQPMFRENMFEFAQDKSIALTGFNVHKLGNQLLIGYLNGGYDRSFVYNMVTGKSDYNCDYMQLKSQKLPYPAYWYDDRANPKQAIGFVDLEDLGAGEGIMLKSFEKFVGHSFEPSSNPLLLLLKTK